MAYGDYGITLKDVMAPTTDWVNLGSPDSADSTQLTYEEDEVNWIPMGAKSPLTSFGPADYITAQSWKFWIPATDVDASYALVYGRDIVATMRAMYRTKKVLQYSDINGITFYCNLHKFVPQMDESFVHFIVNFELRQNDKLPPGHLI